LEAPAEAGAGVDASDVRFAGVDASDVHFAGVDASEVRLPYLEAGLLMDMPASAGTLARPIDLPEPPGKRPD
jgi:hypothetical protein